MPQATFAYDANGNLVPTITGAPEAAPLAPPPAAPPPTPAAGATPVLPPPAPGAPAGVEPAAPLPDYITGPATPATPLPPAAAAVLGKIDQFHAAAPKPAPRPAPGSNLPISGTSTQLGADPARTADRIAKLDASTQAQVEQVLKTGEAQQQRTVAGAEAKEDAATRAKQDAQVEQLDAQLQRQQANRKLSDTLLEKDPEVQPGRLIEQMSTGKQIGMVLLAALSGGFAAANGSNDPAAGAMGVIQSAIDRDIAAQRAQIESGRIRRGNLISYYQQQGMDAKQAEQAARITIGNATAAQAEAQAQKLGAPAAMENAQLLAAKLRGDATTKAVELDASTDARTVVNREAPKAVAAKPMAPDDLYKLGQIRQQQLEDLDAREVAKVIAPVDPDGQPRNLSVKRANEVIKGAQDLAVKLPRFEVAEQRMRQALEAMGAPPDAYDSETGTIDWSKAKDLKGVGSLDTATDQLVEGFGGTSDSQKVQDVLRGVQEDITYATTGATATEDQQATFRVESGQTVESEERAKENLANYAQRLAMSKKSMLAGDVDATKLYQHTLNRGNVRSLKPGVN